MAAINVWYTRRNGEVKGPFPSGLVTRHILLGRIREDDEISPDGKEWSSVSDHPDLIPDVVKQHVDDDPLAQERLMTARRWADERDGERRDERDAPAANEKRRRSDRRAPENVELIEYRLLRSVREHEGERESRHRYALLGIVAALAVALGAVIYFYRPVSQDQGLNCAGAPAPNINWSNCAMDGARLQGADLGGAKLNSTKLTGADLSASRLSGADLSYAALSLADLQGADLRRANMTGANLRRANLTGAKLDEADLSYADLTGADLSGADLSRVKLGNAIWPDGTLCAPASVEVCTPARDN